MCVYARLAKPLASFYCFIWHDRVKYTAQEWLGTRFAETRLDNYNLQSCEIIFISTYSGRHVCNSIYIYVYEFFAVSL